MSQDCPLHVESPFTLLAQARAAGMLLSVEGERLRVRGPRGHEGLARQLLAQKVILLPLVELEQLLRNHDWYSHMSDSFDVVKAGEKVVARMLELVRRCDPEVVRRLWQQYGREEAVAKPTWEDLSVCLQQIQVAVPLATTQEQGLWDATQAEASAAKWSARLQEQLRLPWLAPPQRSILKNRLALIQEYLRDRVLLLIDQDNMQLWIEGQLALWQKEKRSHQEGK